MRRAADEARALVLLAGRALRSLDPEERAELDALLRRHPELDDDSFELAAAAVDLALTERQEPLPPALRARVLETWQRSAGGGFD